jgi:hypothetical protein
MRLDAPNIEQFAFGNIYDITTDESYVELQDFCFDLMKIGKFRLPFDEVAYCFEAPELQMLLRATQNTPDMIEFSLLMKNYSGCVSLSGSLDTKVSGENNKYRIRANHVHCEAVLTREEREDFIAKFAHGAVAFICVLTAILSVRGAMVTIEKAPEKLNIKRARKGRALIDDVRHVTIVVGGVQYAVSGHPKGTHASPRLHWRRGHIRHLASGAVAIISPCLVGSAEQGVVKHDYAVRHA